MRANTVLKLGSLALDVAQNDKIRELATMIHSGAKRRGLLNSHAAQAGAIPPAWGGSTAQKPGAKVPFAPADPHLAGGPPAALPGVGKWLTADNAQKALSWAGLIKDALLK